MSATNMTLEQLVKIADESRSRQLVVEAVRTAYALGKLDGIIELQRRHIEAGQRARQAKELNS